MSDITDLIDQNMSKMRELSQEGDRAIEEVNELEELIDSLSGNLSAKEQETLESFETLTND